METVDLVAIGKAVQRLSVIFTERVLTILGLLIAACLFGWVLYAPDWIRLAAACAYSVLVYYPLVKIEKAKLKGDTDG